MRNSVTFFWFRRDLRLEDNTALYHALVSGKPVIPLFIFDTNILDKLEDKEDKRVEFIHQQLLRLNKQLISLGASLLVKHGDPLQIWKELNTSYTIHEIYANHDYEPYGIERDENVKTYFNTFDIPFLTYKDMVIFERDEVVKDDGKPYSVFTPYSRKWMAKLDAKSLNSSPTEKHFDNFLKTEHTGVPSLHDIGFKKTGFVFLLPNIDETLIKNYSETRNVPAINGTSHLSIHLRFGTLSIRKLAASALSLSFTFLNELMWREFYQMILWHFPNVIDQSFKPVYDKLKWRNNEDEFECWCTGKTGYPLVDAGMRELNETGFMHNRVRMVTASFLTKHLLIDWRWGEAYFAKKLLDFELASNNGGWQWAAGTGSDAAPYFRIFNPAEQAKKFDGDFEYINRWVPELNSKDYPSPIVEHSFARERCLQAYKAVLG